MKRIRLFLATSVMFCLTYSVFAQGLFKNVLNKTVEATGAAASAALHTSAKPWVLDTDYEGWNDNNPIKKYVKNLTPLLHLRTFPKCKSFPSSLHKMKTSKS